MSTVKDCPIASVNIYAGKGAIPYGWLACDGSLMEQATFVERMKQSHQMVFGAEASAEHNELLIKSFKVLCRELVYVDEQIIIPNLQSRFVVGAGSTADAKYQLSATGGQEKVALTAGQIPLHTHTGKMEGGAHSHFYTSGVVMMGMQGGTFNAGPGGYIFDPLSGNPALERGGAHKHYFKTNASGGGQAHSNMPPYFTAQFIIRVLL